MNALTRVPFNITTHAVNFIAGGRPYTLASAHPAFAGLKAALLKPGSHDTEELIGFVDQRVGIMRASFGAIQFDGDSIIYRGQPLSGLWVDKILAFRTAGEDFGPIWNALDRLVKNPTPQAIERLPVFLERSELGFLEDGRFAAFKGIRNDYMDCYSGTFRNQVGDKPTMDRTAVDPDPNATCSRGLHVGTPDYVRSYYHGDNRVMLVAVAPEDVVCVPVDYRGGKMRVCAYEVLDEVPQDYVAELLGRSGNVVRGYAPPAASFRVGDVNLGDVVSYAGDGAIPAGNYTVIGLDDLADDDSRLEIATAHGQQWLIDDKVTGIVERAASAVEDEDEGDDLEDEDEDEVDPAEQSRWPGDADHGDDAAEAPPIGERPAPALLAQVGDLVQTAEGGWPPAGVYPVIRIDDASEEYRLVLQTEHDGEQGVRNCYVRSFTARPWMRVEIGGTVDLRGTGLTGQAYRNGGRGIEVIDMQIGGDNPQLQVRTPAGPWWIDATRVTAVYPKA